MVLTSKISLFKQFSVFLQSKQRVRILNRDKRLGSYNIWNGLTLLSEVVETLDVDVEEAVDSEKKESNYWIGLKT